jgi:hypothetical protein
MRKVAPGAPTPYPDLNEILHQFVSSVRKALGDSFISACLQGSFAIGDFDRCSDVDFVVAVKDELASRQVDALQGVHSTLHAIDCLWAQRLEGSYFPQAVLRSWTERGKDLWYLDNGSRELIRSEHCNTLLVRWVVRERGVRLAGPEPRTLVDAVPVIGLRREMLSVAREWGATLLADPTAFSNRFYQTFIVLSYCRMLNDLLNGYPGSKLAGATWGQRHLDPEWKPLIEKAWKDRQGPLNDVRYPADRQEMERTLDFVRYAIHVADDIAARTGLGG